MAKTLFKSVHQEAYEHGSAAFFRRESKNPWLEGTELHAEWKAGYESAERSELCALEE